MIYEIPHKDEFTDNLAKYYEIEEVRFSSKFLLVIKKKKKKKAQ